MMDELKRQQETEGRGREVAFIAGRGRYRRRRRMIKITEMQHDNQLELGFKSGQGERGTRLMAEATIKEETRGQGRLLAFC